MTEKRFYIKCDEYNAWSVWEKDKDVVVFDLLKYDAEVVCKALNELNDENEQLKLQNKRYMFMMNCNSDLNDEIYQQLKKTEKNYKSLLKENEKLKQFQDRVFSWIDMHLQRLPTLRDDEFESDNEFADPSLYSGAIQILETMKRELRGDVE